MLSCVFCICCLCAHLSLFIAFAELSSIVPICSAFVHLSPSMTALFNPPSLPSCLPACLPACKPRHLVHITLLHRFLT